MVEVDSCKAVVEAEEVLVVVSGRPQLVRWRGERRGGAAPVEKDEVSKKLGKRWVSGMHLGLLLSSCLGLYC